MAAAMVIPMGTASAFAANEPSQETTVKYEVTQGYEWTIHSAVDFGSNAGVNRSDVNGSMTNNKVSVTENIIPDGKKLNITVAGSGDGGAFTIANGNTVLNYTVNNGDNDISTGGTVLDVAAGTKAASKDMTFTLTTGSGTSEVAGEYNGTVKYTASIVNK